MNESSVSATDIQSAIAGIAAGGITADRKKLKQDMCAQFSDHREWAREYAVNAFDAKATVCRFSGRENTDRITITVEDNGHGMNRQAILDFVTVFRSVKQGDPGLAVGRHGVGKLSVAAIPGQSGFFMRTSTGAECWEMETYSLLDDDPIKLRRVEPVPAKGSLFEITFTRSIPLAQELSRIREILNRYLKYLPMDILLFGELPDGAGDPGYVHLIRGSWHSGPEALSMATTVTIRDNRFDVVLGLGSGRHSVYQNRVLISCDYDLLSYGRSGGQSGLHLPQLDIRIDSRDFKPTFGRNRLTNEPILNAISAHLRDTLIRTYFADLAAAYTSGALDDRWMDMDIAQVEAMACSILLYNPDWITSAAAMPVFKTRNRLSMSFRELKEAAARTNRLYLETSDCTGIDFSVFDAPVLCQTQPEGGLKVINHYFSRVLINLGLKDVVIEAPRGSSLDLGPREIRFQKQLGFHPDALGMDFVNQELADNPGTAATLFRLKGKGIIDGLCQESRKAQGDLKTIQWRVNYLVERDGKTPNQTHRFLHSGNTVILNLNHDEVKRLLNLSESAPSLSGHWAMAMCLNERGSILSHLTPEAREDLLLIDAMARCGSQVPETKTETTVNDGTVMDDTALRTFLREIRSSRFHGK